MNLRLMIMTSLAIILFIFCYRFEEHKNQESLLLVLKSIYASDSIISFVGISCISIVVFDYLKQELDEFCIRKKYFAQRISVQEYESQKETYTKLKLNELMGSQAYQDYIARNNR